MVRIHRAVLVVIAVIAALVTMVSGPAQVHAISVAAIDSDPENRMAGCDPNDVPFGVVREDAPRCFSFRFAVPPEGISTAYLHVVIGALGGLSDTDSVQIAVGTSFPECDFAKGSMAGCVVLHGGFGQGNVAVNMNLLDLKCDAGFTGTPAMQAAVTAQLATGVAHIMLQDDTVVQGAELVINEGPASITCGASDSNVNPATGATIGTGTTGTGTGTGTSGVPGSLLPTPPFGSPEPAAVERMTIQGGQRNVVAGDTVWVPFWMIRGDNVANINFEVRYDSQVVTAIRGVSRGSFLGAALGQANTEESGIVYIGYAQTSGTSGTGTIAYVNFQAVGVPGDVTELAITVTTLNDPDGSVLSIDRINGLVRIVDENGLVPGDCQGDGRLNEADALCALQMSVRLVPPRLTLDLDNDSAVTSRDSTIILQRAVGR